MDSCDLDIKEFAEFRLWPILNWEQHGTNVRTKEELDYFWQIFYNKKMSYDELWQRYEYVIYKAKDGPLSSWFIWLKEKHLCFLFTKTNLTIKELAKQFKIDANYVALILRNFFIERYPQYEDYFSKKFLLGSRISENLNVHYEYLVKNISLNMNINSTDYDYDDDVMFSFDITLYKNWHKFIRDIERAFSKKKSSKEDQEKKEKLNKLGRFFREVLLLSLIAFSLIYFLKWMNEFYDDYLVKKIGMVYPDFLQNQDILPTKSSVVSDLKADWNIEEEFRDVEAQLSLPQFEEEERYETESDVVLSSLEEGTPHKIGETTQLQSGGQQENMVPSNFRDQLLGENKVYRILIRSNKIRDIDNDINLLLKKYQVFSAQKGKVAKTVPGGIYYNLLVPKNITSEFLKEVSLVDTSQVIIGHNRRPGPPDKSRVFVWVKEI